MKRVLTEYTFRTDRVDRPLRLAVASDIHSSAFDDVLEEFGRCDAVLVPGDLVDRHRQNNNNALRFLDVAPDYAPVFLSIGNHERKYKHREEFLQRVRESRVNLLDNESTAFHGIRLGGLSSVRGGVPDKAFLDRFEKEEGYRLLMCHHPEMYRDYVSGRDIDLTICGHAHGGQIQIAGHGLYAPGQGFFPKYAQGITDGRLIVSRGLANNGPAPRFGNRPELVFIKFRNDA